MEQLEELETSPQGERSNAVLTDTSNDFVNNITTNKFCSMKKFVLFATTIILSIVACSDYESMGIGNVKETQETQSPNRSIDEAMQIVQSSIKMLEDNAVTRSTSQRKIDLNKTKVCKLNSRTRSGEYRTDTLMYVFNFADNEGFAIIAAPKNVNALLAITESGNYDFDQPTEVEGFKLFVEMAKKYVEREMQANRFPPFYPPVKDTVTTLISSKNPLVTVKWGQAFPEGLYCPNTVCGCANTAAIQIFSYYEYPTYINLTFSQRERDNISINWTELKKHNRGDSCYASHTNCLATIDSHKKIGELARQCAVYAQSIFYDGTTQISNTAPLPYGYTNYVKWNDGATGTIINDVVDMIEAMGYARPTFSAYYSKCTQTPLNSNKPIFMGGQGAVGGHAWIIDGYKYYEDVITDHNTEPATVTTSYRYYNHVNWGWYGNSDGYYFDGIFDANDAYSYDNPSYGISHYSFTDYLWFAPIEM